jgi:hypothetical protein
MPGLQGKGMINLIILLICTWLRCSRHYFQTFPFKSDDHEPFLSSSPHNEINCSYTRPESTMWIAQMSIFIRKSCATQKFNASSGNARCTGSNRTRYFSRMSSNFLVCADYQTHLGSEEGHGLPFAKRWRWFDRPAVTNKPYTKGT